MPSLVHAAGIVDASLAPYGVATKAETTGPAAFRPPPRRTETAKLSRLPSSF